MASSHRKLEHFPVRRDVGETDVDVRAASLTKPELVSSETVTGQLDFAGSDEEARRNAIKVIDDQERRNAIKVIAIVVITAGASLAALIYFVGVIAGVIAGAVALGAVGLLIAFGNSVLDDTIELH